MYCILVAGMPASGKSTIAVRISESLGIPMLSKDSSRRCCLTIWAFTAGQKRFSWAQRPCTFCTTPRPS